MLSRQGNNTAAPSTEVLRVKLNFPKWDSKVAFRLYSYRVDAFITNVFLSMAGKFSIDPDCDTSS